MEDAKHALSYKVLREHSGVTTNTECYKEGIEKEVPLELSLEGELLEKAKLEKKTSNLRLKKDKTLKGGDTSMFGK